MQIDTRYGPLKLTNSTFATTSSITEPTPTVTAPTGDGIIDMGISTKSGGVIQLGGMLANSVKLIPIGSGSDDNTMLMNVYCWDLTAPGNLGPTGLWVPSILATFTCTLGTTVPVASDVPTSASAATVRFCDTITLGVGNANVSVEIISDTSNRVGHIILDAKGAALLECRFSTNSSATAMNCLFKVL